MRARFIKDGSPGAVRLRLAVARVSPPMARGRALHRLEVAVIFLVRPHVEQGALLVLDFLARLYVGWRATAFARPRARAKPR